MDWMAVLSISPDGRFFVTTGRDKQQCVRKVSSGKTLVELPKDVTQAIFSPDAKLVVCQRRESLDPKVRPRWQVYTTANARPVGAELALTEPYEYPPETLYFSPDGKLLAGFSELLATYTNTHTVDSRFNINVWDAITGKRLARQPAKGFSHAGTVRFSPNGKSLIGLGAASDVLLWSVPNLKALRPLPFGPAGYSEAAAFSPDSKFLAACGTEMGQTSDSQDQYPKARLYKVATGGLLAELKISSAQQIVFIPSGKVFVAGSQVWSSANGKLLADLPGANGSIAVSPDGKTVAVVQGEDLRIYDTVHWHAKVTLVGGAISPAAGGAERDRRDLSK